MDSFTTLNKSAKIKDSINTSQVDPKFTPLVLAAQELFGRNYISADEMTELATNHYRTKKGKGITLQYLIEKGLVQHKKQAQDTLKYHLRKGTLFTLWDKRPQQYYATSIKSEIIENLGKNTPIHPRGRHTITTNIIITFILLQISSFPNYPISYISYLGRICSSTTS